MIPARLLPLLAHRHTTARPRRITRIPGIEFALPECRLHFVLPACLGEAALPAARLQFVLPDEDCPCR